MTTFRPLSTWPGVKTPESSRRASPFRASWQTTLDELQRELDAVKAVRIVVELDVDESAIRLDGWPRSDARPRTPGVVVSFDSRHGPLRYACDRFKDWRDNLRAIALGLESLRRVERFGIATRGEQYAGWKALPSPNASAVERGREIIREHGGDVRKALAAVHPDREGGDEELFKAVSAAREADA